MNAWVWDRIIHLVRAQNILTRISKHFRSVLLNGLNIWRSYRTRNCQTIFGQFLYFLCPNKLCLVKHPYGMILLLALRIRIRQYPNISQLLETLVCTEISASIFLIIFTRWKTWSNKDIRAVTVHLKSCNTACQDFPSYPPL